MAVALTRGDDSRIDGAPNTDLPSYADTVESIAIAMLDKDDADGSPRFMGDINRARAVARAQVESQLNTMRSRSAASQAQVAEDYGRRQQDRAQARGVNPEAMPYGASASDVRLANRPVDEASAQLDMEQNAADRVVRGLREGTPTFEDQETLDFLRERGDQNPLAGPGKTDMAMRGAIRERRGQYYEMPDGTRIPVGREPTAAEIRAEREWQDWTNETPGTERQALYNPAGYEQHREGVRQDIRNRAQWEQMTYGTSGRDVAGNPIPMSLAQEKNRAARAASEDRVAEAQREARIGQLAQRAGISREEARQMMDAGRASVIGAEGDPGAAGAEGPAGVPLNAAQRRLESQKLRDMANTRQDALRANDLALRRDNLRNQRLLLAPGGKGVANAINELPEGWRQVAILDRITNGRRGGATPLDVEAQQMANAMPVVRSAVAGMMQDMDPNAPEARRMQRELELRRTAGVAKAAGWDKPAAVLESLEKQGATPAEINMIMTDLFGPGWQPQQAANAEAVRDAAAGAMEAPPPGI